MAEPQYRQEKKFLIDQATKAALASTLSGMLEPDPHAGEDNRYHVMSLYFDDIANTDYFASVNGLKDRKKYRLRMYNRDPGFLRFEKKVKDGSSSYKLSGIVDQKQAESLVAGDFTSFRASKTPLLREVFLYDRMRTLRPGVVTAYWRESYVFWPGNLRIAFDSELCTLLSPSSFLEADALGVPVLAPENVILEVKYDHFVPEAVTSVLSRANAIPMAISKFRLCKRYSILNDWEVS
jgi:hypothetical protein